MRQRALSNTIPAVLVLGTLVGAPDLPGQLCGDNEPATPVPECRDAATGAEVSCDAAGAVRLWPGGFGPGKPGEILPLDRDSTQWRAFTIPGFASGHELFQSLDVVGDRLFVAYNAGLQVWDVSGTRAEDPERVRFRDGWSGHFLQFPSPGENDFFVDDVAAIDPAGGDQDVLIALSGRDGVGPTLWEFKVASQDLDQLYQDLGTDTRQVRVAELGGGVWAFGAGPAGVAVYDVLAAGALASPCLDDAGSVCPGVFRDFLGTMTSGGFVSVLERGGKLYVAASDGSPLPSKPLGVEIWELANPASPAGAVLRFSGLSSATRGTTLFVHGGRCYLAGVERDGGSSDLNVYDVTRCLDSDGCASAGSPVWSLPRGSEAIDSHLTFSTSNGTPFLYYGLETAALSGTRSEGLFDLSTLGGANQIPEITDGGGTYVDACTGNTVDYWGDYYADNGHGLRNFAPRVGKFRGKEFYRAAFGVLDVHVREGLAVEGPGEGFPGEPYTFQAVASACVPEATFEWSADDGFVSGSGATVEVTWPTPGTKTITVTNGGCRRARGTAVFEVLDPAPGVGSVSIAPAEPRVCEPVLLTAQNVTGQPPIVDTWEVVRDSDGAVVAQGPGIGFSFEWDTGQPALAAAGAYTARVTVSNATGAHVAETSLALFEAGLAVTQGPTYDGAPAPGYAGSDLQFRVETSGASQWTWEWGDGSPPEAFTARTEGENPAHTYESPGTYDVPLTLASCDPQVAVEERQLTVEIVDNPLAILDFSAACGDEFCVYCAADPAEFDLEIEGHAKTFSYDWDGDGTFEETSASPVGAHVYDAEQFNVFPRARVRAGDREDVFVHVAPVTVIDCELPSPYILVSGPAARDAGHTATYRAAGEVCTAAPDGWTWTAGGAAVIAGDVTSDTVSITWPAEGSFTVTATNSDCPATGLRPVTVTDHLIFFDGFESGDVSSW